MDDFLNNPLTDEEQTKLRLKRERNNKISKIMGDYLLKGYKMLGSSCNKCQTILLRDRQDEDYCIGCVEIDVAPVQPDVTQVHTRLQTSYVREVPPSDQNASRQVDHQILETSIKNLQKQIQWTNECLSSTALNLEQRTQLVIYMKTCYETLTFLIRS